MSFLLLSFFSLFSLSRLYARSLSLASFCCSLLLFYRCLLTAVFLSVHRNSSECLSFLLSLLLLLLLLLLSPLSFQTSGPTEGRRGPSKPKANLDHYSPTDYGSTASARGPRYRPSAEKLSRLLFGKHAAMLGCLQASVEGSPCNQPCCQSWNPDNQVPPRGWIATPKRQRYPAASAEDVALVIHLYGWGYNMVHPNDTRHCKEVLPYVKNGICTHWSTRRNVRTCLRRLGLKHTPYTPANTFPLTQPCHVNE